MDYNWLSASVYYKILEELIHKFRLFYKVQEITFYHYMIYLIEYNCLVICYKLSTSETSETRRS